MTWVKAGAQECTPHPSRVARHLLPQGEKGKLRTFLLPLREKVAFASANVG